MKRYLIAAALALFAWSAYSATDPQQGGVDNGIHQRYMVTCWLETSKTFEIIEAGYWGDFTLGNRKITKQWMDDAGAECSLVFNEPAKAVMWQHLDGESWNDRYTPDTHADALDRMRVLGTLQNLIQCRQGGCD